MSDLTDQIEVNTLKAIHTARMTASSIVDGVKVMADPLHLDEIPGAMDSMGWEFSAKLMRRWFATQPAYSMPSHIRAGQNGGHQIDYAKLPPTHVEDQIIKMKWLLNFDTVVEAFEDLVSNWCNPAGKKTLRQAILPQAGWIPGKTAAIGRGLRDAKELDSRAAVNFRVFGEYSDVLDDLYGSVFKATLKVAIVGRAVYSSTQKSDIFEVDKIGVYMRDTYDFGANLLTDSTAGLGVWSRKRTLSKIELLDFRMGSQVVKAIKYLGFVSVKNSDFSRWQKQNNTGGDFFVFSDVMWIKPAMDYFVI